MPYTSNYTAKKKKDDEDYAVDTQNVTKVGGTRPQIMKPISSESVTKVGGEKPQITSPIGSQSVTKVGGELPALNYEVKKPAEYESQFDATINSLLDQIVNKKQFSYDFNADPMYQQYKDNYVQQGNQAMMNTMANAASLTGGYGNSYATSAGAQANQQYLNQLNNVIPELYSAAVDKYNMDAQNLMNQYSAVADADDRAYGRYADAVANDQWAQEFGYQQERDKVSDNQWQQQFDFEQSEAERAYQQWLEEFGYQKQRDETADNQWQQQFDYQQLLDERAYQQWLEEFGYQQERDQVSDKQWQQQFGFQQSEAERAYQQWLQEFGYQQTQDNRAYDQWLQEFNYQKEQDTLNRMATSTRSGSSGGLGGSTSNTNSTQNNTQSNESAKTTQEQLNAYIANSTPTATKTPTVNDIATFAAISNTAAEKAAVSTEALETYLVTQVNRGVLSQFDADRIYDNLTLNKKKTSGGGTGGTSTPSKVNNRININAKG